MGRKRYAKSGVDFVIITAKVPKYVDEQIRELAGTYFVTRSEVIRLALLLALSVLRDEFEVRLARRAEGEGKVPMKRISVG